MFKWHAGNFHLHYHRSSADLGLTAFCNGVWGWVGMGGTYAPKVPKFSILCILLFAPAFPDWVMNVHYTGCSLRLTNIQWVNIIAKTSGISRDCHKKVFFTNGCKICTASTSDGEILTKDPLVGKFKFCGNISFDPFSPNQYEQCF